MLEVRKFEPNPEAYEAIVPLHNAVHDMWPSSADEMQRWDAYRDPRYQQERLLGYVDGRLLFSADVGHSEQIHRRGRRMLSFNGLTETNGTEHEREFFRRVIDRILEWDPFDVVTIVPSTQKSVIALLDEWGFGQTQRERVSERSLDTFDASAWDGAIEKVRAAGIELVRFDSLNIGEDATLRHIYDMAAELFRDVPQPDEVSMESFDVFCRRMRTIPYDPRLRWYARKDGRMIGQTVVINNLADPSIGYTGLTGIRREYRRTGVATALKASSLKMAKEIGLMHVHTENEENNPMFDLNVRLGFREKMSWLHYSKKLREPTEEDLRQD